MTPPHLSEGQEDAGDSKGRDGDKLHLTNAGHVVNRNRSPDSIRAIDGSIDFFKKPDAEVRFGSGLAVASAEE